MFAISWRANSSLGPLGRQSLWPTVSMAWLYTGANSNDCLKLKQPCFSFCSIWFLSMHNGLQWWTSLHSLIFLAMDFVTKSKRSQNTPCPTRLTVHTMAEKSLASVCIYFATSMSKRLASLYKIAIEDSFLQHLPPSHLNLTSFQSHITIWPTRALVNLPWNTYLQSGQWVLALKV